MKRITVWIHDGSIYQEPYHIWDTNINAYIAEWREILYPEAKKANADHFIYATKIYDSKDELTELNIYSVPLNDKDFTYRTDNLLREKRAEILAWHKGTSY